MNEKLQYASMLEIPVNTCNISSIKPKRKLFVRRKKVSDEQVKQQLLEKINGQEMNEEQPLAQSVVGENETPQVPIEIEQMERTARVYQAQPKRKKIKVSIVGVQLAIIGLLVATILFTNAIYVDSGINVFLRGVFGVESASADGREFDEFSPVICMGDNYNLSVENGVITFAGEGSVYSACDGVVQNVVKGQDGTYSLEISHSQNFKSVISGIERVYVGVGDTVKSKIPVGYLEPDGATMCFMNSDGEVIADYQIENDTVVWAE